MAWLCGGTRDQSSPIRAVQETPVREEHMTKASTMECNCRSFARAMWGESLPVEIFASVECKLGAAGATTWRRLPEKEGDKEASKTKTGCKGGDSGRHCLSHWMPQCQDQS